MLLSSVIFRGMETVNLKLSYIRENNTASVFLTSQSNVCTPASLALVFENSHGVELDIAGSVR